MIFTRYLSIAKGLKSQEIIKTPKNLLFKSFQFNQCHFIHISQARQNVMDLKVTDFNKDVEEVKINAWIVNEGEKVYEFNHLCTVKVGRATKDIFSPYEGVIQTLAYKEGEMAKVGSTLLKIETSDSKQTDLKITEEIEAKSKQPLLDKQIETENNDFEKKDEKIKSNEPTPTLSIIRKSKPKPTKKDSDKQTKLKVKKTEVKPESSEVQTKNIEQIEITKEEEENKKSEAKAIANDNNFKIKAIAQEVIFMDKDFRKPWLLLKTYQREYFFSNALKNAPNWKDETDAINDEYLYQFCCALFNSNLSLDSLHLPQKFIINFYKAYSKS